VIQASVQAISLLFSGDAALWAVIGRSLWVSSTATLFAALLGTAAAFALMACEGKWRGFWTVLLNTYVSIPAVLVGLLTYLLLSRSGPLGGLAWLFSVKAMMLAQTLLLIPLACTLIHRLLRDADEVQGDSLRVMGASPIIRYLCLLFHDRHAVMHMLMTCFGRGIAEVGTVMVVGGNIEGFTRVMTTAIALETTKGDLPMALALGMVLLLLVLLLNVLIAMLPWWRDRLTGVLRDAAWR
jgi:tungstate transport system permease protein